MKHTISNADYATYTVRLLRCLLRHKGEQSAVTGPVLGDMLGLPESVSDKKRFVAELAGLLTGEGFHVCSGYGYWYEPDERKWIDYQLAKEEVRAKKILAKVSDAKKNSVNEPSLFDMANQVAA